MNKTYKDAIEIIAESVLGSNEKDLIKLIFNDKKSRFDEVDLVTLIDKKFVNNNIFLDTPMARLGYSEEQDVMLALKVALTFSTGLYDIFELEERLAKNNFPTIDGKGNWFIVANFKMNFTKYFDNLLYSYIEEIDDVSHEKYISNKVVEYSKSPLMKKLEVFAKKIAESNNSYKSIINFLRDFEKGIE